MLCTPDDMKLHQLRISAATVRLLASRGVVTVADLYRAAHRPGAVASRPVSLLRVPALGEARVREIMAALRRPPLVGYYKLRNLTSGHLPWALSEAPPAASRGAGSEILLLGRPEDVPASASGQYGGVVVQSRPSQEVPWSFPEPSCGTMLIVPASVALAVREGEELGDWPRGDLLVHDEGIGLVRA